MTARAPAEGGAPCSAGEPAAFDVTCAFEPLARLVKRSPTLDGAVPLRVAQACVPMLEGNAAGLQVVLDKRLVARTRLGRKSLEPSPALAAVDSAHRAAVPLLAARGLLAPGGPWPERLARSWWWSERGVLRIWTGLLVRPRRAMWLRVSGTKNRGVSSARMRTAWIACRDARDAFTPLVLDVEAFDDGARLEGEVATVLPVLAGARVTRATDDEARALASAHASFYDPRYFAAKKGEITRKYRRMFGRDRAPRVGLDTASEDATVVAELAGPPPGIVHVERALGAEHLVPAPLPPGAPVVSFLRFSHAVPLRASFDGNVVDVTPDRVALAGGARAVRSELARLLGDAWLPAHEGAVLYLTKYVTPHPHGEPHFFVKPWAFVRTPPGWSSVVEGISGDGYELLRGVVRTDSFHATPAVFQLSPGGRVRVAAGAPMLDVLPVPRAVLDAGAAQRSET